MRKYEILKRQVEEVPKQMQAPVLDQSKTKELLGILAQTRAATIQRYVGSQWTPLMGELDVPGGPSAWPAGDKRCDWKSLELVQKKTKGQICLLKGPVRLKNNNIDKNKRQLFLQLSFVFMEPGPGFPITSTLSAMKSPTFRLWIKVVYLYRRGSRTVS